MVRTRRQTYWGLGASTGLFVALLFPWLVLIWLIPGMPGAVELAIGAVIAAFAAWRAFGLRVTVDEDGITSHGVFRTRRFRWDEVDTVVLGDPDSEYNEDVSLELTGGRRVTLHGLSPPAVPWMRRWNPYRGIETLQEWGARHGVDVEDRRKQ